MSSNNYRFPELAQSSFIPVTTSAVMQHRQTLSYAPVKNSERELTKLDALAIFELNRLLDDLGQLSNPTDGKTWKAELIDCLTMYLGPHEKLIDRLHKLCFKSKGAQGVDASKRAFRYLIKQAQRRIETRGGYVDPDKKNCFSRYTQEQVVKGMWAAGGAFVAALSIAYSIGVYMGGQNSKSEPNRYLQEKFQRQSDLTANLRQDSARQSAMIRSLEDSIKKLGLSVKH